MTEAQNAATDGDHVLLRRAQRIPLDIVVTATSAHTPGVIVAVLASDLDALEDRLDALNNLAAAVASHAEDAARGLNVANDLAEIGAEAAALWDKTWPAVLEMEQATEADDRASDGSGATDG